MTFSYVDISTISDEEYEYLLSINEWIDKAPQTQVYVVKDHNDIKSVFCLKQDYTYQDYTYMELELCFGTKERERHKGYCSFGFYMILEVIKNNPSIKEVLIIPINKETDLLCEKAKISGVPNFAYHFNNPNFNPKYEELESKIINGISLEEIVEFCDNDETMLNVLDLWIESAENEKNKRLINR